VKLTCNKCKIEKEACLDNFYWRKDTENWNRICKTCKRKTIDEWESKNKEKMLVWHKEWNKKYNKKYYQENAEKEKQRTRDKPKEAVRRYARKQMLKIKNRLRRNISRNILYHMKNGGSSKNNLSHLEFLDWNYNEFVSNMESKFEPWMSWNNYGQYNPKTWDDNDISTWTWQIDHIIPHSDFDYSTMDCQEFRDCWALTNLRPYSSKQNLLDRNRKNNKKAA
jgi:hypothetical protein